MLPYAAGKWVKRRLTFRLHGFGVSAGTDYGEAAWYVTIEAASAIFLADARGIAETPGD